MTPVDQTLFGDKRGNCFSACVASLLDVACDDLPNIHDYPDSKWFAPFNEFLAEHYGQVLMMVKKPKGIIYVPDKVPFIVSANAVRGLIHAVVMQYEEDGTKAVLVHDPHPSRNGVTGEVEFIGFLVRSK